MENIKYKGYIIAKETEPWAIIAKILYYVYPEGQQGPEDYTGFETVEECKSYIDGLCDGYEIINGLWQV